jgi:hypothetical protein
MYALNIGLFISMLEMEEKNLTAASSDIRIVYGLRTNNEKFDLWHYKKKKKKRAVILNF